jgi:hypothetical protein
MWTIYAATDDGLTLVDTADGPLAEVTADLLDNLWEGDEHHVSLLVMERTRLAATVCGVRDDDGSSGVATVTVFGWDGEPVDVTTYKVVYVLGGDGGYLRTEVAEVG